MASILRFSVELRKLIGIKETFSLGKTNWFISAKFNPSNKTVELIFTRSNNIGKVKIGTILYCKDAKITINTSSAVLVNGEYEAIILISISISAMLPSGIELKVSITINDDSEIENEEDESSSTDSENAIVKNCRTIPKLLDDFLSMLNHPDSFADATLKCDSVEIPVHRNILSSRSSVFAAIFKTQKEEGLEGVVDIVDMEPEVLQAMLRYIYSGTDQLTCSMAGDLLFAADKYQLEELKLICVEKLKVGMAADNVFQSIVSGDLLDESLKEHAIDFLCKFKNFAELEGWKKLLAERPALAVDVLSSVVKYFQWKCGKSLKS